MNGPHLPASPLNVLYLHSHDTGRYIQPYGHPVPTPNLQRLADQGILFRRAFATAATCSGSRAALITGQYPHRNGMIGLAHRGFALHDPSRHLVNTLGAAGYHSELIGEQHVSDDPAILGYDRVHDITSNHVATVAPLAAQRLGSGMPEPFFLSVGFFETHRSFFEPSTVRDALYSLPPVNLPDTPAIRRDMAAFKASARHLDQGVGTVLEALDGHGLGDRTLVVCTTDHGLPFPGAKATLYDRGLGVLLMLRGPGGFWGGRVVDAPVSHLDLFPTVCELAGIEQPAWLDGDSLLPLVRGEVAALHDELFAEITYHAAYEPQRAIRTDRYKYIRRFTDRDRPVLPNVDDGPTKDELLALGWEQWDIEPEQLYDLELDPNEMRNLIGDPRWAAVADDLRARLERWMRESGDPLLDGPVAIPAGAWANDPDQRSASDPPAVLSAA
jgi:N-sulfoglucosamine sulfohydrolase